MSARNYIRQNGSLVAVEVGGDATVAEVERELQRVYGAAYRPGRWSRRGRRWRAEVVREKLNHSDVITQRVTIGTMAGDWFEGEV